MKPIKLAHNERVIAVVPEHCGGPGWSNAPTWVYIADSAGKLREECIQPSERNDALVALWSVGEAVQRSLIEAVPVKKMKRSET